MLYSGDEWASVSPFQYFTNHSEPELADAVRQGRRHQFSAFGWAPEDVPDPQALSTFENSKLNWSEFEKPEHRAVYAYVRALITLRATCADLRDGHLEQVKCTYDKDKAWLVVERNSAMVVANLGPAQTIVLPSVATRVVLSSNEAVELLGASLHLPQNTACVVGRAHIE
jgi:maltooligosyltrehalose trehalohydrolase